MMLFLLVATESLLGIDSNKLCGNNRTAPYCPIWNTGKKNSGKHHLQ
ncbi:hypothetical protein PSI23_14875 [Xenorhabdus sp. XENO-10]|uniref:Uncharacterized protein n=1 Tax=Xenorhabdus yunnanensis TaxID=3025878 RepID=A0ABT5LL95_9GAMM|nr:hypothetical protein [Xenorhabdus yunnanensis]MDC9590535.1 hypothetical protein [Xenorhabdus yunnanensis]